MASWTPRVALHLAGYGATAALVISAVMTLRDWRLNPGGIFHGEAGTHWQVVFETAWSWFWPSVLLVALLAALLAPVLMRRN